MACELEKLEGKKAKLTITVSAEDFDASIEKVYRKRRNSLNVPGFRKGKIPRAVIERLYGKGFFYEEAVNALLPEAYEKAYYECGESIVSEPKIDVVTAESGKDMVFTAEVTLEPDVVLPENYKSFTIEKIKTVADDEDVENALKAEREKNARQVSVEGRAAKDGDTVIIDYEGSIDGVPFDGGAAESSELKLGSGTFIPGFEEQLIGVGAGESKDVTVPFPEDYHAKELAGKEAVFKCLVHEIKTDELPELDDDFASEVSEFDTLAEYRVDLKKMLTEEMEKNADLTRKDKKLEKVLEGVTIDIPDSMISFEQRSRLNQFERQLQMQGMDPEMYYRYSGLNRKVAYDQMKLQALTSIRQQLTLKAIATAEGFSVTDEDLEEEKKSIAEIYGWDEKETKENFEKPGVLLDAKDTILMRKASDFLNEVIKEA